MKKTINSTLGVMIMACGALVANAQYGGGGGAYVVSGGGGFSWSNYAAPVVNLFGGGQVLGASTTSATCNYMIPRQAIGFGLKNDPAQVKLLQSFLNKNMGSQLLVNGIFDPATQQAVQAFQNKYSKDILTPWGLTAPTEFAYYTTINKINGIMCSPVPLNNQYLIKISKFLKSNGN